MRDFWWSLPGPSSYVERIVGGLSDGQNVIVIIPKSETRGLRAAIQEKLEEIRPFTSINFDYINRTGLPPARYIHEIYEDDLDSARVLNAKSLAELDSFCGNSVWIENVNINELHIWYDFLCQYQHTCQCHEAYNRGTICLLVSQGSALGLPTQDVALTIHYWNGAVGRVDISTYIEAINKHTDSLHLLRRLKTAIVTELALSDSQLAIDLSAYSLKLLIDNPQLALLRDDISQIRTNNLTELADIEKNMMLSIDGTMLKHSSVLALEGNLDEIKRRVWAAQIAVLFPALEQARIRLLNEDVKGFLSLPFSDGYEEINELFGLELGHIWFQIKCQTVPSTLKTLVYNLRKMRISLAHLTPVEYELICNPQVLEYLSGNS